jgi:hypothetical protein
MSLERRILFSLSNLSNFFSHPVPRVPVVILPGNMRIRVTKVLTTRQHYLIRLDVLRAERQAAG